MIEGSCKILAEANEKMLEGGSDMEQFQVI